MEKKRIKVLIDAGHGRETAGKRSPDGAFREYISNRELARAIESGLICAGIEAELLVTEETDISLGERCRRANRACDKYGKENVLLVSVHSNAGGNGEWTNGRGWSVYTSPGKTAADELATCIYNAADASLSEYKKLFTSEDTARHQKPMRADWSDGDPDYEARFYILVHTKCAAVLTESLFYDNRADLAYLQSEAGRKAIVEAHVKGIIDYINRYKK